MNANDPSTEVIAPWYKQPWAWFVLTPLIVVVIACSITVSIAFDNKDDVVLDNYYKEGRLINDRFEEDIKAKAIGAKGRLQFDIEVGEVFLDLQATSALPEALTLQLSHPVKAEYDQQINLQRIAPQRYRGDLVRPVQHRWYVRLLPATAAADGSLWRLDGEIDFSDSDHLDLDSQ